MSDPNQNYVGSIQQANHYGQYLQSMGFPNPYNGQTY